ncbi:MAG: hypothetical protein ABR611_13325, partial [Chthoniobacterales bacterium]
MIVHLVDGTYELFRHFYGLRRFTKGADRPYGAVIGVLQTVLAMIERGDTYIGVATDHVIESFRNRLWAGYKTGAGIERALLAQFHPLEETLTAMGVVVWPMIELEADDALASAAHIASKDKRVEKVAIWTPDKDLAQCVRGTRIVQIDGRRKIIRDAAGVREKFGVDPPLIPDLLGLVGDAADGYPGIPGIGAKTAADRDLNWIDLSGNADLRDDELYVWVQGRPNEFTAPGRPASPFAPKSSRVARALLRGLARAGLRPRPLKPVETGCDPERPADALALREAAGSNAPLDEVCPYRFPI